MGAGTALFHPGNFGEDLPAIIGDPRFSSPRRPVSRTAKRKLLAAGRRTICSTVIVPSTGSTAISAQPTPGRVENTRRVGEVARLMTEAGLIVIYSSLRRHPARRMHPPQSQRPLRQGKGSRRHAAPVRDLLTGVMPGSQNAEPRNRRDWIDRAHPKTGPAELRLATPSAKSASLRARARANKSRHTGASSANSSSNSRLAHSGNLRGPRFVIASLAGRERVGRSPSVPKISSTDLSSLSADTNTSLLSKRAL